MQEIAEHLDISVENVLEAMESTSAHSLAPLDSGSDGDEGGSFSLLDVLGDVDPMIGIVEDRTVLAEALREVSPEAQRILHLRFFEGLTQTEIARQTGVSQMQVSRMLRKTLRAMREHLVAGEI